MEVIYQFFVSLFSSWASLFAKNLHKLVKPKILILLGIGCLLGFFIESSFSLLSPRVKNVTENAWLTSNEKKIFCETITGLIGFDERKCYSIEELKEDFQRNKAAAVDKYSFGEKSLSDIDDDVDFGLAIVVGKFRKNSKDYTMDNPCIGGNCLRRELDLGQYGKVTDPTINEDFYVIGELAVELLESDFQETTTVLLNSKENAFMAFGGVLRFEGEDPRTKWNPDTGERQDTHSFVIRLRNAELITP